MEGGGISLSGIAGGGLDMKDITIYSTFKKNRSNPTFVKGGAKPFAKPFGKGGAKPFAKPFGKGGAKPFAKPFGKGGAKPLIQIYMKTY
jgi:hypothetical protein